MALALSEKAWQQQWSIFGLSPFVEVKAQMGRPYVRPQQSPQRTIVLSAAYRLPKDLRYVRLEGVLPDTPYQATLNPLLLVNSRGVVVGAAFAGEKKLRFTSASTKVSTLFNGYVLADALGQTVDFYDQQKAHYMVVLPNAVTENAPTDSHP